MVTLAFVGSPIRATSGKRRSRRMPRRPDLGGHPLSLQAARVTTGRRRLEQAAPSDGARPYPGSPCPGVGRRLWPERATTPLRPSPRHGPRAGTCATPQSSRRAGTPMHGRQPLHRRSAHAGDLSRSRRQATAPPPRAPGEPRRRCAHRRSGAAEPPRHAGAAAVVHRLRPERPPTMLAGPQPPRSRASRRIRPPLIATAVRRAVGADGVPRRIRAAAEPIGRFQFLRRVNFG